MVHDSGDSKDHNKQDALSSKRTEFRHSDSLEAPENKKKTTFRINKPLVPLKIALFLWYGAGSIIQTYQMLFFKQRGLTIAQLSLITIINPAVQFLGPAISGLIADKIGKSKPILLANIALVLVFVNSMMLIPYVSVKRNTGNSTLLQCSSNTTASSDSPYVQLNIGNCTITCSNHTTDEFSTVASSEGFVLYPNGSMPLNDQHIVLSENLTSSWCGITISHNCILVCNLTGFAKKEDNTTFVFLLSLVLIILFNTTFSNCYRFLDVTAMSMVKSYGSDFGRERVWTIISTILLTPLSGYLIQLFISESGTKNYLISFYMFDILLVLVMINSLKLEVQIKPPGTMMWKKTVQLLRNLDVLVFILSVLVLGSCWGFMRVFNSLYLDELGATSMVYALMPAVSSIAGLPFLLTSNWWVRKIGSTNLLILGFLGYTFMYLGYSFLVDPWMCLICELFTIFTYHLLWVAVVRHSHQVAPEGLTATVIATAGGIHYGLGRGTGSLVGGLIMSTIGGRQAYRAISIIAAVSAVLLAAYSYFRRRYKQKRSQETTDAGVEMNGDLSLEPATIDISSVLPAAKQAMD